MQGNGRVLAFYKHLTPDEMEMHLNAIKSLRLNKNLLLFTNKFENDNASADELKFIKEILGYKEDDFVVLGAGDSDALEDVFAELNVPYHGI